MALTKVTKTGSSKNTISEAWDKFNDLIDDLLSTSSGLGASCVGIQDSAENMSSTNVETALAEIYTDTSAARTLADVLDENSATTTGLTWGYKGGLIRFDNTVTTIAAGTVSLTDDSTNYVEINSSGTVQVSTTSFTSGKIPIRQITTVSGAQTVSTDKRAFFASWPDATTSLTGVVELATVAESILGTDTTRSVTPSGLMAVQKILTLPKRPKYVFCESLDYDGGTVIFVEGETVTGAGGATGVVEYVDGDATSGTLYIHTRNATAYNDEEVLTGSVIGAAVANGASSKNSIVIYPFAMLHYGTIDQIVYSISKIAYEFANLGTSDMSYLYLDDSAIVTAGTNVITATQLIDAVTEPAQSFTRFGHYNGSDKCIFAMTSDGSDNLNEFFHDGGDYVEYADQVTSKADDDVDNDWTHEDNQVTLTAPVFSRKVKATFYSHGGTTDASVNLQYRPKGATADTGHIVAYSNYDDSGTHGIGQQNSRDVFTNSSQEIQIKHSAAGTQTAAVYTNGYFFPSDI